MRGKFAFFKVIKVPARLHLGHVDRKVGVWHLVFQRVLQFVAAVGGVKEELIFFVVVERPEKRDTLNVVPMKVRKKDVRVKRAPVELVDQLFPQDTEAGAAVEDIDLAADANLDAGCIPAISYVFRLKRGGLT